jgi:hypothetical protein
MGRCLGRRIEAAKDAGIYGFIANIYFFEIETPLKQFVVSHGSIVQHCCAIHDAVMAKRA